MNWLRNLFRSASGGSKRTNINDRCYPGTDIPKIGFDELTEDRERGVCAVAVGLIDTCPRGGRTHRLSLCFCLHEEADRVLDETLGKDRNKGN